MLIPHFKVDSYVLLSRPLLVYFAQNTQKIKYLVQSLTAQLACIRHAASVYPEPGSNSQKNVLKKQINKLTLICTTKFLMIT
jgi:hypothetical protein